MKIARISLSLVLPAGWLLVSSIGAEEKPPAEREKELLRASADSAVVQRGRETYASLCQSCHGEEKAKDTLGDSPSNLFDEKWYNGNQPTDVERNILNGFSDKGMPAWKEVLPAEDTTALAAYLLSFQKRDRAKAPEGSATRK